MEPFRRVTSIPIPLLRDNIDTDIIMPARYLKTVTRSGLGQHIFENWRKRPDGSLDPAFPLNDPRYQGAAILVAGRNFGCGSSREHAVWGLVDRGIRVVIAESFADIFASNAVKNGLLTVELARADLDRIAATGEAGRTVTVDLEACCILLADGVRIAFSVDPFRRRCLLEGLDEVTLTLARHADAIRTFEEHQRAAAPWLWETPTTRIAH